MLKEATALFIVVVFIFNHSVERKVNLHVLHINVLMHTAVVNKRLQFRDKKKNIEIQDLWVPLSPGYGDTLCVAVLCTDRFL